MLTLLQPIYWALLFFRNRYVNDFSTPSIRKLKLHYSIVYTLVRSNKRKFYFGRFMYVEWHATYIALALGPALLLADSYALEVGISYSLRCSSHLCLLWKLWSWLLTEILYYMKSRTTMQFPIVCLHNFRLYGPFLLFTLTWRWTKQSQVLFLLIILFDNGPRFKTKLKIVNMIRAQFLFFALWFIQIMPYLCSFLSCYLFLTKKVWDLT